MLSKSLSRKNDSENEGDINSLTNDAPPYFDQEIFLNESKYLCGVLKFFPPVYVQRYGAVCGILQAFPLEYGLKKVADFGCSQMEFFMYLKNLPGIEKILEIDVDENLLRTYACKAGPLNSDYLFCKRNTPLEVYVVAGSIAEYDDYLVGVDAVVAIEVIEHLVPDVLDKVPYNIFHNIKPKIAIFTTPNADFNELFPNKRTFRNVDHKFEWSRKEFFNWIRTIIKNYPHYSVKLYGIGRGPEGTEHLGCCTQMAVFERTRDLKSTEIPKDIHNYKLIRKFDYPYYVDKRTNEEKIIHQILYWIKFSDGRLYLNDDCDVEVPLGSLMDQTSQWCSSEEELKKILIKNGFYIVENNGENILVYPMFTEGISESDERYCDLSSEELNTTEVTPEEYHSEDWDRECGDGNFYEPAVATEEESPVFISVQHTGKGTRRYSMDHRKIHS